ncbi:NADPH-dependent FMN reductase, partial [Enterococcus faecalis]|uniref:NADPH-dependent FMN reductase n=1 Tax=Enterococcus faecalis TaxID=1351 RepID=UPI00403F6961
MNIEIISGSPRQASVTNRLALFLQKEIQKKSSHNIGLIDVRDYDLGFLQTVFKNTDEAPEQFKPLAERMFAADAFIIVT